MSQAAPASLARRFEAVVFDWDGTAVPDRSADATAVRHLVEEASRVGLELAIVTGTHVGNVDGQLCARPAGPGRLTLLLNRGSEVFRVDADGPHLVERRTATAPEERALSRAAELTVERLAARGLEARVVSERLNRKKIDLIPVPGWEDPPKARIAELLAAVQQRLAAAGIAGLTEAVAIAHAAALDAGLADPRVTSDAKHVEIGLTDKADSARWIIEELWRGGIAPEQVLVAGDEFGSLGGLPGSDANLLAGPARNATAVSVGAEPGGVPNGVIGLGGGPDAFVDVVRDQVDRRRRAELPIIHTDPGWTLHVEGVDPLLARVDEARLTLADGWLGTRGSVITDGPAEDPGVLMTGVYAHSGARARLLAAPQWNAVRADLGPRPTVTRVLDLHSGTLSQRLAGGDGRLDALLLSSLARPATAALRVRAYGIALQPQPGLSAPTRMQPELGTDGNGTWMRVAQPPGSIAAALGDQIHASSSPDPPRDWSLDRTASYAGDPDGLADEQRVLGQLDEARALGFDRLLAEHRRAWAARWDDADIGIDGDPDLQLAVRLALFHLMASVPSEGEAAVGARGLSGGAYRGHVFWDSDVYVLPFLAATHPQAARAMLEYRIRRLPAALRAARAQHRARARFPRESATSGNDVTPKTARDRRGHTNPVLTGTLEEHIVADVAWAAMHYADWTGDEEFTNGPGRELLVQTARWWASRIERDPDGRGHIRGVIGPDEYHENVDDNAYTNVMARWNLRCAASAAGGVIDQAERHRWSDLATSLVDGYDPDSGLYEQFAGFFALEPLVVADIAPQRPIAAEILLGRARTQAAQVVKQADVLMLHHLLPGEVAAGSLEPNLDFYEPRTTHGSTLSPGIHAALLARARRTDEAMQLLRLTTRIDLDDIGQTTAGGVHMAAMGSVWQALAHGFAGLAPTDRGLAIDPVAMPDVHALDLRVRYRDSRVRIRITRDRAHISSTPQTTVLVPGHDPLVADSDGCTIELPTTTEPTPS